MAIVTVRNLVKRYDEKLALDHFNLQIDSGEVFGLLGPNGSGKTTTINCILQLLTYDKGEIELFGHPEYAFVFVDKTQAQDLLRGWCRLPSKTANRATLTGRSGP
jgi:ABC-type multidrug transport system ATPase subunit